MKKIAVIICILMATVFFLTACGGSTTSDKNDVNGEKTAKL